MDKQIAGKDLFLKGWTQKRISLVLDVSEKTVGAWAAKGRWREDKEREQKFKVSANESVRKLIMKDLEILNRIADIQQSEITDKMTIKELRDRLTRNVDIDALAKLHVQIKGKELEWDIYVRVVTEITKHLENDAPKLAKDFQAYANDFLNSKRKEL
jgi:hypothetical protein